MHHRHIALQLIPLPTATCVQKHQNIILLLIRVSHSVFLVVQVRRLLTMLDYHFYGAVISNQYYYLTITRHYWKRSNSVSPTWWVKCTNILLTKCWVAQNMHTWGINGRYCTKKGYDFFSSLIISLDLYYTLLCSKNNHDLCAFWTSVGECETNRNFMQDNCAAACRLCLLASTNFVQDISY